MATTILYTHVFSKEIASRALATSSATRSSTSRARYYPILILLTRCLLNITVVIVDM
jgi:hypothetical protein